MALAACSHRRTRVVESFGTVREAIGPLTPGMALFIVSRGQWSMIDAIRHVLDQVGTARVSLWPRTVAVSKGDILTMLRSDPRVTWCRLVMNTGDERKNHVLVQEWQGQFGLQSVCSMRTHAKIATLEGGGLQVLIRGSINLGTGARFEQIDVTEGGEDFRMIRTLEASLPPLPLAAQPAIQMVGWF